MASNINPNIPSNTAPTTSSVRNNFAVLKSEIEALQTAVGNGGGQSGNNTIHPLSVKNVVGAYTIELSDINNNTMVRVDVDLAQTADVTIPHSTTMPCPLGSKFLLSTSDYGYITVVGAPGVTICSPYTTTIDRRHGRVLIIKTEENTWEVDGQLAK